jgi:Putative lumazine-binding
MRVLIAALLSAAAPSLATAQSAEAEVRQVVTRLFDAMRAGDSATVRAVFHPRAMLGSVLVRSGRPELRLDSLETFVRSVGTPHPEVWDERLSNVRVQVDGPLAALWTDYDFYAGSRFSHCGVDAFQLARTETGWRIIALTDTRRRGAECPNAPKTP